MVEVEVSELRNRPSAYLGRVSNGEELIVTYHGKPVARVIPVEQPRPYDRLVAEGFIEPSKTERTRSAKRVKADGSVSELVGHQRR